LASSHTNSTAWINMDVFAFQTLLGSSQTPPEPPLLALILRYLHLKFLLT
jgi:hypothetical protein